MTGYRIRIRAVRFKVFRLKSSRFRVWRLGFAFRFRNLGLYLNVQEEFWFKGFMVKVKGSRSVLVQGFRVGN